MPIRLSLLAVIFSFFFLNVSAQDTTQKVVVNRYNSVEQQKKPYVILISLDAFRWDLAEKYQAKN
ncbi:MAG: alkaline phosphatase family protein, partial [Pedobacter sp.]